MHMIGMHIECVRQTILQAVNELAWLVNGEMPVRPFARRREQFDGIMMLRWRSIFDIDRHIRAA